MGKEIYRGVLSAVGRKENASGRKIEAKNMCQ